MRATDYGRAKRIIHHGNASKSVPYGTGDAGAVTVTEVGVLLIACKTLPKCDALVRVWLACRPCRPIAAAEAEQVCACTGMEDSRSRCCMCRKHTFWQACLRHSRGLLLLPLAFSPCPSALHGQSAELRGRRNKDQTGNLVTHHTVRAAILAENAPCCVAWLKTCAAAALIAHVFGLWSVGDNSRAPT